MGDDGMLGHPQGHMGHHAPPAHAQSLMQTMNAMNGHHHMGHTQDHDMARKYGLHTKMADDHQANMTLNLVKTEGIPSHYLYGPLDHPVTTV